MLGTHVAAVEPFWKAAQSYSLQLKIALFNTDEMRFEWGKKMSEIPNGLEIKLARLLFTEMALAPAMRRGQGRDLTV